MARSLCDERWLGVALWALGRARYYQGDFDGAAALLHEALPRVREAGNPLATAFALWTLGDVAWDRGEAMRALPLLRQALAQLWELRETWSVLLCLERLATACTHDQPRAAIRLFAAAAAWRDAVGMLRPPVEEDRLERAVTVLGHALSADAFAATWADGQSLSPEQAIAEALDATG
jgi:tetratricopeptide (TPR) repeat protein